MRRRKTTALTGVALAGVAGAVGVAATLGWGPFDSSASAQTADPGSQVSTGTAGVIRTNVADRHVVSGTLGFTNNYDVIASGPGVLTRLPTVGERLTRGKAVYELDGKPVALFYGSRPVWRPFQLGMSNGSDVQQLETNLKALGYGNGVTVDRHFSSATYYAVRRWQIATHRTVTGTVPLGQIVFLPGALRIGGLDGTIGTSVQPGTVLEHGTSSTQAVNVQLSPTDLPSVRVGDAVAITLPDGSTRKGTVSAIGAIATPGSGSGSQQDAGNSSSATSTAPITVTVKGRITGLLDQTQVQVSITAQLHKKVLAVPTTALRAVPGGGYQVVVVNGATTRRVPVQTGLFDEITGLAEVSGPGLAVGQLVEVPSGGS